MHPGTYAGKIRAGELGEKMRILFLVVGFLALCAGQTSAHEIYLKPQCKQGVCYHPLLRGFEPPLITKSGVLRRYESALVERKCKPDEVMDEAECRLKRPALDEFKDFVRAYTLCSTSSPVVFMPNTSEPNRKGSFIAYPLEMSDRVYGFQGAAYAEYFTVCHNWQPADQDNTYFNTLRALNYKPLDIPEPQKQFASEAELLAWVDRGGLTSRPSPSLTALQGKWYADNQSVCKGSPGETEGLLTFRGKEFIGMENGCDIRSAKVRGQVLMLDLSCAGEGMTSREIELFEFPNDRQMKRTVADGRKRYTFTYTRCP